jgi:hypothetical protein
MAEFIVILGLGREQGCVVIMGLANMTGRERRKKGTERRERMLSIRAGKAK